MKREDRETLIEDIERCRKIIFRINNPTDMTQSQPSLNDYKTLMLKIIETLQHSLNINHFLELPIQLRQHIHHAELLLDSTNSSSSSAPTSNDINHIMQQLIVINKKINFICK